MTKLTAFLKSHPLKSYGAFIVLLFIWCNISFPRPDLSNPRDKIEYGRLTNNTSLEEAGYDSLRNEFPDSLDIHYEYITAYFATPAHYRLGRSIVPRDDDRIITYYRNLSTNETKRRKDIGFYGLGLCYSEMEEYDRAILYYDSVSNPGMKYLNNSYGFSYAALDQNHKAVEYFNREIDNKGNVESAYLNLFRLYYKTKNYTAFGKLLETDGAYKYCSTRLLANYYFVTADPLHYPVAIIRNLARRVNLYGFMGAFLILIMWLVYLRFVDVFEPERWQAVIIVALGGMVAAVFVFPISDFTELVLGYGLNNNFFHDMLYYILNVGAVEELVKIIPLLILIWFTKLVREPIDYLVYGCISALGFGFAENLLYFDTASLYIIHIRGFMSVVGHMFFTSVIAYGLMTVHIKKKINPVVVFLLCYAVAATLHGLFDFFLSYRGTFLLSYGILMYGFYLLGIFLNNALNQSNYANKKSVFNVYALSLYLICGLVSIYAFEYFVLSVKFGNVYANNNFFSSANLSIYLLIIISKRMSNFEIIPGYWEPFGGTLSVKRPEMSEWLGSRIEIIPFNEDADISVVLPASGTVVKRLVIKRKTDSLLVKMDTPMETDKLYNRLDLQPIRADYVVVRCKPKSMSPVLGSMQPYYFILVSEKVIDPETDYFGNDDLFFIDWVLLDKAGGKLTVADEKPAVEPFDTEDIEPQ